jgi:hypothetical protein
MDPWTASVDSVHGLVAIFLGFLFRKIILKIVQNSHAVVILQKDPCYTTKSDTVMKTNPNRVFWGILSVGYTKSGKRSVKTCNALIFKKNRIL